MPFELNKVVPWGRSLAEYKAMFKLSETDLKKNIISFGDGPASFNKEMTESNNSVTSLDRIYKFSEDEIKRRIAETKNQIIEQTKKNMNNFIWKNISTIDELEKLRLHSMNNFLHDFNKGKKEGRYIYHELPERTTFIDKCFDLGLSSHFLLLYSSLGLEFHLKSISEMIRICKEIRIFPLLNLNAQKSELLDDIISYFNSSCKLTVETVDYEFQKGADKMVKIINY